MKLNIYSLLLVALFFAACKQKDLSVSTMTSDTTFEALIIGSGGSDPGTGKDGVEKGDCFELVYPLSITMPDNNILSGDKEYLWEAVKAWYEAHPDSEEKPALNYPIDILWNKEDLKTINNEDQLETTKQYCKGEKKENCFELVYPVSWTMPDGSSVSMEDGKDWDAVKVWYEVHPDSEEKPSLNFPVDIIFGDGSTQSISEESEMISLKAACE